MKFEQYRGIFVVPRDLQPFGVVLQSLTIQRREYRPFTSSELHGFAGYLESGSNFGFGYIQEIFQYKWKLEGKLETYAVLDAVHPSESHPFCGFPEVGVKLFDHARRTKVIQPAHSLRSAAWAPWSDEAIVVFLPKDMYMYTEF
ncbi:hypothetical protein CPB86DRAFT_358131 [Serendipita vermifera]|nr:hypothetical protein CPB86DRAFT_358131 [Serendipita vermifera]